MILRAPWVVPVATPPIRDGFIQIAGDRIQGVGPLGELPVPVDDPDIISLPDCVITPGLVNPHVHLELTCYAGELAPAPLWDWLARLVPLRARPGQKAAERASVHDGAWQALQAGTTCVGDIARRPDHFEALRAVPIRKVCFIELLALADDPPRTPDELRQAVETLDEDDLLTVGISPHAPYTVSPAAIRAAISLADELARPWCMHWSETSEERAYVAGAADALPAWLLPFVERAGLRPPGTSPADLLARCTHDLRPGALAHGNYLDDEDVEQIADLGHAVIYCPRAHHFFGHESHPFQRLLDGGVTVAFGTDSAASNENLNPLEEARFVKRHVPQSPAADVLFTMLTYSAARALGLDGHLGTLEVGKWADIAAFPIDTDSLDPVAELVNTAPPARAVWVAGTRVIPRQDATRG